MFIKDIIYRVVLQFDLRQYGVLTARDLGTDPWIAGRGAPLGLGAKPKVCLADGTEIKVAVHVKNMFTSGGGGGGNC